MRKSKPKNRVTRKYKPTKVEQCLMLLAEYMEDPHHDQYKVAMHVMDILGIEKISKPRSK